MKQLYRSQSQPVCDVTFCVARCHDVRVPSRRKYVFTDQIDQLIREIYLNHRKPKSGSGIRLLSKKVGMPHWALKKRARELGLARTKELPWSERELEIMSHAWALHSRSIVSVGSGSEVCLHLYSWEGLLVTFSLVSFSSTICPLCRQESVRG